MAISVVIGSENGSERHLYYLPLRSFMGPLVAVANRVGSAWYLSANDVEFTIITVRRSE